MKRFVVVAALLSLVAVPSFCKTHKETCPVSCSVPWPAVKDVLRNFGKYGTQSIDYTEMTASYMIGGTLGGKRVNSVVLNAQGDSCQMQIQTAYSGFGNDDEGDFKKRVDKSRAKLQAQPAPAKKPRTHHQVIGAPPALTSVASRRMTHAWRPIVLLRPRTGVFLHLASCPLITDR